MNQFFQHWVDLFAMVASILLAIFVAIRLQRKALSPLRPVALFFLLFGPLVVTVHMSMHLLQNAYIAVVAISKGAFVYSFRFYSLILMGGLIGYLSLVFLKRCIHYYVHKTTTRKEMLQVAGVIALVSVPTIPFTPIGSLPLTACIITLVASLFVRKKQAVPKASAGEKSMSRPVVFEDVQPAVVPDLLLHEAMRKHHFLQDKEVSKAKRSVH